MISSFSFAKALKDQPDRELDPTAESWSDLGF